MINPDIAPLLSEPYDPHAQTQIRRMAEQIADDQKRIAALVAENKRLRVERDRLEQAEAVEAHCRRHDEARVERLEAALDEVEACMSIVEPRSDKAEYLRILAVVRAALADNAAAGEPEGWRPIETCPKEKEVPYLLLYKDRGPMIAEWNATDYTSPGWDLWLEGERYGLCLRADCVTHWMPLPVPPTDNTDAGTGVGSSDGSLEDLNHSWLLQKPD